MEIDKSVMDYLGQTEEEVRAAMAEIAVPGLSTENRQVEFSVVEIGPKGATAFIPSDFKLVGLMHRDGDEKARAFFFRNGNSESEEFGYQLQQVIENHQQGKFSASGETANEDALLMFQQYYDRKHQEDESE